MRDEKELSRDAALDGRGSLTSCLGIPSTSIPDLLYSVSPILSFYSVACIKLRLVIVFCRLCQLQKLMWGLK